MWLRKPRGPMTCHLPKLGNRKARGVTQSKFKFLRIKRLNSTAPSLSLKALEPGVPVSKVRRIWCLSSSRESKLILLLPFCFTQNFKGLADTHLH